MNLEEVLKKRKSVRQYRQDKPVPDKLIKEIIELAKTAPSAGGIGAYDVILTKERITGQNDAPVYLIICSDPEKSAQRYGDRGRNLYSLQDATIFGSYIQLIAVDKGLSNVWVGAFREGKLRRTLNIPDHLRPVAIISLGYGL